MSANQCEGSLYVQFDEKWKNLFCWIRNGAFQAFEKQRVISVSNQSSTRQAVLEFQINNHSTSCKQLSLEKGTLQRILLSAGTTLPETPYFFEVIADGKNYTLACDSERDRERWIHSIEAVMQEKSSGLKGKLLSGFGGERRSSYYDEEATNTLKRLETISNDRQSIIAGSGLPDEEEDDFDNTQYCCKENSFFRMKVDTLLRLLKVCSAFPFVIVVATLNISNTNFIFRSVAFIRLMNLLIYLIPFLFVDVVLSNITVNNLQTLFVGIYISIYLIPVGYVVFYKLKTAAATHQIEEGTFCFRPGRSIRWSWPNAFAIQGFVLEFIQHCTYVFPLGIITKEKASTVKDMPPYIPFLVYFWGSVACVFICGLILVLNAVLRGKKHYRLQNSSFVWLFIFNIGGPCYVSVVTLLFMGVWCDYNENPPVLVQDRSIVCWERQHTRMAVAALMSLAVYLIQMTLLPSGTYKETMQQDELDIMFVPVYLQAHFLLKAIFCGVYVSFYQDDWTRVVILTTINLALMVLNAQMKPCSVQSVNVARDTFFLSAALSGLQSLNYIANSSLSGDSNSADSVNTKALFLSTIITNVIFVHLGMFVYYRYSARSTKYQIARTLLDLDWQLSQGGSVHPRVLEPLISLTLSAEQIDLEIAKNYIKELVNLIAYPNIRVQFQSAWGLANLALVDEDARVKIHKEGGTQKLFEWYLDMEKVVQLETLAALVNLTLSYEVADDMVNRFKCIPFFLSLVSGTQLKHAQFSAIAIGNLARKELFRDQIRKSGGIPVLVGCIMSSDYQKKRYGALALANMALSPTTEIVQVFASKGLLDRIIKMGVRQEIETQREVTALIRNLSCHARLRPILLERHVVDAIRASEISVFPEVVEWTNETIKLLEKELEEEKSIGRPNPLVSKESSATKVTQSEMEVLLRMTPLEGSVTWSTWGSKLESIFTPIFAQLPALQGIHVYTRVNAALDVHLAKGIAKDKKRRKTDSMMYAVMERPSHGKLSEYTTSSEYITYTPNPDYSGTDFFTFRLQVGSLMSAASTVAITVGDEEEGIKPAINPRQTKINKPARKPLNDNKETVEMSSTRPTKSTKESFNKGDIL